MGYALYVGRTKQEAVDKMFTAARVENRLRETMLIRTHQEERRKWLGLRTEKVWVATAYIDENRRQEKEKKPLSKREVEPRLFNEMDSDTAPIQPSAFSSTPTRKREGTTVPLATQNFIRELDSEKSKRLEEEVQTLKTSIQQIQEYIKTEFEDMKEGLIKNNRNTALAGRRKIVQDLEISQKNIVWAEDFLREREFHAVVIKDIVEFLKTQKNELLLDKAQIITLIRDFLKANIVTEETMLENYNHSNFILLAGPTGVGKTVTIIKMAVHLAVMRHKTARFISIDRYKVGADSQLKTYADLMKAPFYTIQKEEQFFELLAKEGEADFTFIDTAGKSPRDTIVMKELAEWIKKSGRKIDIHLVVSATTKPRDLDMIMDGFGTLDFSHVIATKLDETACLGSILSAMYQSRKPLSFITNGQAVPEDFEIANVEKLIADSLK